MSLMIICWLSTFRHAFFFLQLPVKLGGNDTFPMHRLTQYEPVVVFHLDSFSERKRWKYDISWMWRLKPEKYSHCLVKYFPSSTVKNFVPEVTELQTKGSQDKIIWEVFLMHASILFFITARSHVSQLPL